MNSGKDFVFKQTLNLLIGAESAVRQRRIRPGFLSLNFTLLKCKRSGTLLYNSE
ncbi:hypothetical protein LEP1GSC127_3452 [Leptospira kirschneri str. 200801925]|uniref:Uncharacterized protein n=3 Tax=Leptospira kirschneri TaxID=29507 RepID=A0A0E2AZJ2_9LEPT|nr:hypothetical protein LEP1GSC081_0947 [Leptospira kirschneri str. H1]EKO49791.1 hypothetical protein LEP1GSC131_0294 [Leptospira kirschneri str. 200802841]EMJ89426.1 hypothetical protein LEP1GSC198_2680 [Leptospira kirschneri str. JB]EMK10400.1 hypothetical protein LEP1GSC166_0257 [Leptospira kirschneri]EMK14996.1 hypothetical protein LEP1GSC042_0779 [Leptospira kirschneri serovar Bim str. PUO 1247]EMK24266.1 hypothetical protein LEP1GSC008_3672 [Leptospira kirschneri serovar Bulgarica str. 